MRSSSLHHVSTVLPTGLKSRFSQGIASSFETRHIDAPTDTVSSSGIAIAVLFSRTAFHEFSAQSPSTKAVIKPFPFTSRWSGRAKTNQSKVLRFLLQERALQSPSHTRRQSLSMEFDQTAIAIRQISPPQQLLGNQQGTKPHQSTSSQSGRHRSQTNP